MNSVGDQLCKHPVVCQDQAENAGLPLMEGPHGVKDVRRLVHTGIYGLSGLLDGSIRMADRYLNSPIQRFSNQLQSTVHLGRHGHLADRVTRDLDEAAESFEIGRASCRERV